MKLYEIDFEMQDLLNLYTDPETGELSPEAYHRLFDLMEIKKATLTSLMENLALEYKNTKAEAEMFKAEKMDLEKKQKQVEGRAERLKEMVTKFMELSELDKVKTDRGIQLSWRSSKSVEVEDWKLLPMDYLKFAEPTPDKAEIKKALDRGEKVAGASLVSKQNIQIK